MCAGAAPPWFQRLAAATDSSFRIQTLEVAVGRTGSGGSVNNAGGTGGGGYWTYFGGGGAGAAGSTGNGLNGGDTIMWTGECQTPGGAGGEAGGAPGGIGGKGAGFTDENCRVIDPAAAGAPYGGGGGGGNGDGGDPMPGASGVCIISWMETQPPTLGNYPDTTIPLSTDTTVTADAGPTNTTSINVSASTNFKGKLEGDPMSGVVRVTDAHPEGTYTVTVTAFDSGGTTATTTFTLTMTTPVSCTPVSFAATANFGAGTHPWSLAVGDFNGDNKQDVAIVNINSANVSILLGDGAGNFSGPTNFGAGLSPTSVAVGDFNGDGKQDLAIGHDSVNNVSILLGDGAGNFSAATNFGTVDTQPDSVAVGDFNGDGKQDLVVANYASTNVSILLGDGAGNFSAATSFGTGSLPRSIAVGDFNGDGKQDLAVANEGSNNVSILLGDGAGNFSAAANFSAGVRPFEWRWAISMVTGSKTSPSPSAAQTTCRSYSATARAILVLRQASRLRKLRLQIGSRLRW